MEGFLLSDDDASFDHTIGLTSSANTSFESNNSQHVIGDRTLTDVITHFDQRHNKELIWSDPQQQQHDATTAANLNKDRLNSNRDARHMATAVTSPAHASHTNGVARHAPFDASPFRIERSRQEVRSSVKDDVISCDGDDEREDDDDGVPSPRTSVASSQGASDMASQLLQVRFNC